MASIQAHAVVKGILALSSPLVTRVGDPAVRLHEYSRSEVLLAVPPVGWARRAAACAQDALVETVKLLALILGLTVLAALKFSISILLVPWQGKD